MAIQSTCILLIVIIYLRAIEDMPSYSEKRMAMNAYTILKSKGPDPYLAAMICIKDFE
jgi:hypothetical protein